jgi:hypothetical protein
MQKSWEEAWLTHNPANRSYRHPPDPKRYSTNCKSMLGSRTNSWWVIMRHADMATGRTFSTPVCDIFILETEECHTGFSLLFLFFAATLLWSNRKKACETEQLTTPAKRAPLIRAVNKKSLLCHTGPQSAYCPSLPIENSRKSHELPLFILRSSRVYVAERTEFTHSVPREKQNNSTI